MEYALRICPSLKIDKSSRTEKWILRKAFESVLPDTIIWRVKTQFAEGYGSAGLIRDHVENHISDKEYQEALTADPHCRPRSKEELFYYRIFTEYFGNESVASSVGRWEEVY